MSEFSWIQRLQEGLGEGVPSPWGIGDDGACLDARPRVVVTDMMVEAVHFDRRWSSIEDIAWKLYASNASDVLAMGAEPETWLLSMALPRDSAPDEVDAWIAGFRAARRAWGGGALIGGDTTRSAGGLVVSVTMFGHLREAAWTRAGFREGQGIYLDGVVGYAAAGLELLTCHGHAALAEDVEAAPFIRQHRTPMPSTATRAIHATGAFDVSDGLSADLMHAARASGVSLVLTAPLPGSDALLAIARRFVSSDTDARTLVDRWQLQGGDDYVRVVSSDAAPGPGWVRIGSVEAGPPRIIDARAGTRAVLPALGYDHFRGDNAPSRAKEIGVDERETE